MTVAARHQLFTAANPMVTRIIPELAKEIGLNESIMLLQLDWWVNQAKNCEGGKWWTFQSVRDMQEKAFPYWSLMTINRTVKALEAAGYITVGNFNKRQSDSTRWITLNYKVLEKLKSVRVVMVSEDVSESDNPYQNDTGAYQNDTGAYQNDTTLPETPQITPEKTTTTRTPPPFPVVTTPITTPLMLLPEMVEPRTPSKPTPAERSAKTPPPIAAPPSPADEFNIVRLYLETFGGDRPKQKLRDFLYKLAKKYPQEWIEEAFEQSAIKEAKTLSYTITILETWQRDGKPDVKLVPKSTPPPAYVPLPQAPPMTKAEIEAIKAQVRAKMEQEDAS